MDRFRRFDEAYYHRFYESPQTRVVSAEEHHHLAQFVFSFAEYNKVEMKSVLDIGAGVGLWKHWIEKHQKGVAYTGTEVSTVMCKKHGFQHRDIARWRDRKKHDLIVCQGVLQYLPDPDVAPAVANIAAMSRGLVYVEVVTRADLRDRADKAKTDTDVHVRNGSYYRGILAKHFVSVGCGLWWAKDRPPPFWERSRSVDMEGKTLLRVFMFVSCVALTALGYRNSNGDNSDAIAAATRAACGSDDCSASLEQQSRGSFGHEYSFKVERTVANKKTSGQAIVSCERELVLVGDWRCTNKTRPPGS